MPKANCSVISCSNSTYKINKWKTCTEHSLELKPPFHLHTCYQALREKALNNFKCLGIKSWPKTSFPHHRSSIYEEF